MERQTEDKECQTNKIKKTKKMKPTKPTKRRRKAVAPPIMIFRPTWEEFQVNNIVLSIYIKDSNKFRSILGF